MSIQSISGSAASIKAAYAVETGKAEKQEHAEQSKADNSVTGIHGKDTIEISKEGKEAEMAMERKAKGLDLDEMRGLHNQQMDAFHNMLANMVNRQAGAASAANGDTLKITNDLFKNLTVTPEQSAQAAQAISEDGEWGVNAVATRIMDMVEGLSGGDASKFSELKDAVEKGFKAAEKQWGGKMPSITGKTQEEINKRFEYLEERGSMTGYAMPKAEDN